MSNSNPSKPKNSDGGKVQSLLYIILDYIYRISGTIFGIVFLYLLWGVVVGPLSGSEKLSANDYTSIKHLIISACSLLVLSGGILIISVSARFYNDELVGYILLIMGALFYWGSPFIINNPSDQTVSLVLHIVSQIKYVGMIAIIISIPFMLYNLWALVKADKLIKAKVENCANKTSETNVATTVSGFGFSCWNTLYCREHMRSICDAYKLKKACWRIRSGCYCDKNIILRALKAGSGANDKFYDIYRTSTKQLSWMQKHRRCQQCIMYISHQKLKYRILSPLAFIIPIAYIWTHYSQIIEYIRGIMQSAYSFVDKASILVRIPNSSIQLQNTTIDASSTAEFILLICFTIIIITLFVKTMEYLIFKSGI